MSTLGGNAVAGKRTIYGYDVVEGEYSGTSCPHVQKDPSSQTSFNVGSGITATFSFDGDSVKINDSYIVYQYNGDTSDSEATGDGNNDIWFALNPDGTGTNTSGGLGNSKNPTHMVTTPFVNQCTQVDKVFFCSIPENTIGEFTFCAKYCNASEFQYQLSNSTGGDWSISPSGVLTLLGQDYENMLVKFEQIEDTTISQK